MKRPFFLAKFLCLAAILQCTNGLCPTRQDLEGLRSRIDGELVLPGDDDYFEAGTMKSTNYNSGFNFVLHAKSIADVQEFAKFVNTYGMRPTVRSSGHDYTGRSAGVNTTNLSFEKYKERSVNLNDSESSTGSSITVSSGNAWLDLYTEANKYNKVVVGGSAHTVAMGGYFQGGGHSPLSPKLGLGVDQIISFTMVTVDGDVVDVTKTGYTYRKNGTTVTNGEVFRAIMGGGGGVFGYITHFRMKMHEPPSNGFVQLSVFFALSTPQYNYSDIVMEKYASLFLSASENWGGFLLIRPGSILPDAYFGTLTLLMLHWGGMDGAQSLIDDIKAFRPDLNPTISVVEYETFYDYAKGIEDPTGYRSIIANRFLQDSDLQSSSKLQKFAAGTLNYGIDIGCTGTLIGRTASVVNPATSVGDKFRSGRVALSCGTGWGEAEEDKYYMTQFNKFTKDHLYHLGAGTYYNEPDPDLSNWKIAYWGTMDNYNRLLAVKKELDPNHVLWCRNCVGSDETTYTTPCPSGISKSAVTSCSFALMMTALVAALFQF